MWKIGLIRRGSPGGRERASNKITPVVIQGKSLYWWEHQNMMSEQRDALGAEGEREREGSSSKQRKLITQTSPTHCIHCINQSIHLFSFAPSLSRALSLTRSSPVSLSFILHLPFTQQIIWWESQKHSQCKWENDPWLSRCSPQAMSLWWLKKYHSLQLLCLPPSPPPLLPLHLPIHPYND